MDKERKKQLRGILFQHLDGITLCSTIATFFNKGITEFTTTAGFPGLVKTRNNSGW